MSYTITIDDHEPDGRVFTYPSEAAHEAALDWYNHTSKEALLAYAREHGLDIFVNPERLRGDWADIVMEHYGNHSAATA